MAPIYRSRSRLSALGAAGIEVALHALHNLGVEHVTLVSHHAQSRLPQIEPTDTYECQWFTRDNMRRQPTAENAQALLKKRVRSLLSGLSSALSRLGCTFSN